MREGSDRVTCWIDVDLAALRSNYRLARRHLPGEAPILAVVKADAYGHGAVPVSRVLQEEGASVLGVATVGEARELREAGIQGRILILGRMVASQVEAALRWGAEVSLHHSAMAEALSAAAVRKGVTVPVHVKVDTGMTRLGFPWESAPERIREIAALPGLELRCVFTHFANADLSDREFTRVQLARFDEVMRKVTEAGITVSCHIANSAAILTAQTPDKMGARPGIMLYGSAPSEGIGDSDLKAVLSLKCRVLLVKEVPAGTGVSYGHAFVTSRPSRIATISVGYADGYMRCLTNKAQVLIRGRRAPVVGRVTMDMTMVDVTDLPEVQIGDEVVLIGRQGDGQITAAEVADWAGTISYEIFCALSHRVPRFYRDEGEAGSGV